MNKPKVNSEGQKELNRLTEQFDKFEENIKSLTLDEMNKAPVLETEPQTKISAREMKKTDAPWIEPTRSIKRPVGGKYEAKVYFNEKFRPQHDYDWQYVKCICENHEIIGEHIEVWTSKYGCDPAHFWRVPVNKPVYIPRLVAERIADCKYHVLRMDESIKTSADGTGEFYGAMVAKQVKHRLDCRPQSEFTSVSFASTN